MSAIKKLEQSWIDELTLFRGMEKENRAAPAAGPIHCFSMKFPVRSRFIDEGMH